MPTQRACSSVSSPFQEARLWTRVYHGIEEGSQRLGMLHLYTITHASPCLSPITVAPAYVNMWLGSVLRRYACKAEDTKVSEALMFVVCDDLRAEGGRWSPLQLRHPGRCLCNPQVLQGPVP